MQNHVFKTTALTLALVLMLGLCACTSNAPISTPSETETSGESEMSQNTSETSSIETDEPTAETEPILKLVDANGNDLGTELAIPVGTDKKTFVTFYTENIGELNPKVGWDDSALVAAGMSVEMCFEPQFGLTICAEKETAADLRVYLSATDDWSDVDNPPVELIITVTASGN